MSSEEDEFEVVGSTLGLDADALHQMNEESDDLASEYEEALEADAVQERVPVQFKTFGHAWQQLEDLILAHRGQYVIYDLETVPDESRFPRPSREEKPDADVDLKNILTLSVDNLTGAVKDLSINQITELIEMENQKAKPRDGALKAMWKAIEKSDQEWNDWTRLALDPWGCRIVSCSFAFLDGEPQTVVAAQPENEIQILLVLHKLIENGCVRVGFNIREFDELVLIARSMILNVSPGGKIRQAKWSNPTRVDLMDVFFPGQRKMSCKELSATLGINIPAGEMDGSGVLDLVDSQDFAKLGEYNASDVLIEREMFLKARRYLEI